MFHPCAYLVTALSPNTNGDILHPAGQIQREAQLYNHEFEHRRQRTTMRHKRTRDIFGSNPPFEAILLHES